MVGIAGVEPTASCSQSKRLTPRLYPESHYRFSHIGKDAPPALFKCIHLRRISLSYDNDCDSVWVRTKDLFFRRELLYPAELRNQEKIRKVEDGSVDIYFYDWRYYDDSNSEYMTSIIRFPYIIPQST
jgi:hypothetical protein